jgi:hypothetical protein
VARRNTRACDHDAIFPAAFHFHAAQTRSSEVAEEALRVLPDPVDEDQIAVFLAPHAITMDELASRTGAEM